MGAYSCSSMTQPMAKLWNIARKYYFFGGQSLPLSSENILSELIPPTTEPPPPSEKKFPVEIHPLENKRHEKFPLEHTHSGIYFHADGGKIAMQMELFFQQYSY